MQIHQNLIISKYIFKETELSYLMFFSLDYILPQNVLTQRCMGKYETFVHNILFCFMARQCMKFMTNNIIIHSTFFPHTLMSVLMTVVYCVEWVWLINIHVNRQPFSSVQIWRIQINFKINMFALRLNIKQNQNNGNTFASLTTFNINVLATMSFILFF